jgi:hypothetical protein
VQKRVVEYHGWMDYKCREEGSCFDKYCHIKKEAQCQDTMEKQKVKVN